MKISSNFDSGNIEIISAEKHDNIRLKIRKDTYSDTFQWFYFRLHGAEGFPCVIHIENAGEASYPEGWDDYNAYASYDRISWFCVPTKYSNGVLTIEHTPEESSVFYAYSAPFTYEQHLDMVSAAQRSPLCVLEFLGETVEGRDIDLLIVGEPDENKKKIWILGRQHPGEPQAEWFIQGVVERILDQDDPVSRKLLSMATFYLVPNANIDGSIDGNLRVNAAGKNLNREWGNPDKDLCPEVYFVRNKMQEVGVDLFLDIHADEGLPYCFVSAIEGIPSFDDRLRWLLETFTTKWAEYTPDFQTEHGYPKNEPGKANLNIGSKFVGEMFKCLSMTIEMPFKDNKALPDKHFGWSSLRSIKLGESILNPILSVVEKLR
ncbi:MAG TPA: M14-type cytosolic carboxypeptidase [Tenuifilaceae bacterium]|nr:M14-type cytosolic carboxypeptidase [Tenuifilaceae bacterium]HPE18587.1 M14-type cytosolic carboxypeptidase [Tenuifilaceae bacterium]HPJ46042.1 M14-type cytosolic carboxypeptidase [Tenuifilaceae bacterium]HPQ34745.1 M14-type cytosolic carboxypeptidase [Tenuifilaceae bacterium]HRX67374.1 M14-type cytosolic carboxypeptidase [Tenuifilaceae bacterium]